MIPPVAAIAARGPIHSVATRIATSAVTSETSAWRIVVSAANHDPRRPAARGPVARPNTATAGASARDRQAAVTTATMAAVVERPAISAIAATSRPSTIAIATTPAVPARG